MPNPNKKRRLSVYLEPGVTKALAEYAARRAQPRSLIAEAAIASFLSPDAAERQEAALTKRLDQLDRRIARLERTTRSMRGLRDAHSSAERIGFMIVRPRVAARP